MHILVLIIIITTWLVYYYLLTNNIWIFEGATIEQIGVFGDSWGALTSLFTALGFYGLILTLDLQRRATRKLENDAKKREESEKLRDFENSFFNMLNILQVVIKDMRVTNCDKKTVAEGRSVFLYFYKKFSMAFNKKSINSFFVHTDFLSVNRAKREISNGFRNYFASRSQNLSHYYRFVYNIFKFIDESDLQESYKKKYASILRAQLSNYELLMLFYNAQSPLGSKFIKYIDKYALFDNLPANKLIQKTHVVFFNKEAWGENEEALRYHV
mgnify:CR=1 FL=1